MVKILKNQYLWLGMVLIVAFWFRLYKIDAPIADWHSWRQVDTAAVTRNFIKMGFNPFVPRFDDMSGISDPPIVNPSRFRFVEFPVYNIFVYPFYLFFGVDDKYHRLVSAVFSLGSIVFLYFIVKKYSNTVTGILTSLTYALLPFNVFFSRTTLPESTFVFFVLGMMYFVDQWIWEGKSSWGVWGFLFTVTAFLIKPWAIFFIPPLIYSILKKENRLIPPKKYFLFFLMAITPFILWRLWILQQPEGIPASSWLMNGDGIRFRPAFWWWLISERISREILGVTGFVLFIIGILIRPKKGNFFFHIWLLSMLAYFVIFATGNIRHNYYQYIFVPIAAVFLTQGFIYLILPAKDFLSRIWTIALAIILLPLAFYFSFTQIKGFYQINNSVIIEAGKKANQILPQDAIVVAPYNGDTAFLYQTNRPGWPVTALPLVSMVADYGVTHFVSTTRDDKTNWVLRHFKILEDNPKFVIADLTKILVPLAEDREP